MICDQPDNRDADSAELAKLANMVKTFGYHGIIMLSKPCPKCERLHMWRMISTLPPDDEGHVQQLLHHAAAMIDAGIPEPFDVIRGTDQ